MRTLFVAALLIGVLAPFASGGRAHACYCVTPEPDELVLAAEIVFVGKLDSLEQTQAHFVVDRYLKGDGDRELTLTTFGNSTCGYFNHSDQVGNSFLVVADELSATSICSGNAPIGDQRSAAYIAEVESLTGAGHPAQESEPKHKDVPWIPILILALAIPTAALVIPAFFGGPKKHE